MLRLDTLVGSQHRSGVIPAVCQAPKQRVSLTCVYGHSNLVLATRISSNIARLRDERGWSRPELGRRCQPPTSGQQIERLEKGQRGLDADWIERIARALGVDPVELVVDEANQFELTPQVADEVAIHLARIVLRGGEPSPAIAQDLSLVIQELSATFARHPQARRDPLSARIATDFLTRQHGRRSS
jgi:transcriptional regulator with XRE-family HTH domain